MLIFVLFVATGCFSGCNKTNIKDVSKNLTNYYIEAEFNDENKTLNCHQIVDYINPYNTTLSKLEFHLYPNAFSTSGKFGPVSASYYAKAYANGDSVGGIQINKVKVGNEEKEIKLDKPNNEVLVVDFSDNLYPNDRIKITLEYVVTLPNCWHRFGYGDDTYNLGNFYPVAAIYENGEFYYCEYKSNGDPFYSDMANYTVKLTCDKNFVLASSGKQVGFQESEINKKTTTISAQAVRDFAFVMSKKFEVLKANVLGVEVLYYFYDDDYASKNLQTAVDSIKTFSDLFGKYPYSTMSVVKTDFIHGGMEYPNLVYISDAIEDEKEYLNVIVHETAHQWWYNLVGSNACEYAWLDEGLTEYSTLMFYKYNKNYGVDVKASLNNSLSSYILFSEIYKSVYGELDEKMTKNVNNFKGDLEYVYTTYVKGVLFFDNLNELVGSKNFIKALKLYFNENCYKNATPQNLIYCFEKVCKRSLSSFFDAWVNGKVVLQNYNKN